MTYVLRAIRKHYRRIWCADLEPGDPQAEIHRKGQLWSWRILKVADVNILATSLWLLYPLLLFHCGSLENSPLAIAYLAAIAIAAGAVRLRIGTCLRDAFENEGPEQRLLSTSESDRALAVNVLAFSVGACALILAAIGYHFIERPC